MPRLARNFFKAALASQLDINISSGRETIDGKNIRIVVGNFTRNVVEDVGLGNAIGRMSTNPTHQFATVTKEVTVESSKSTTRESECRTTIVWKKRVSVLEESD